MATYRKSLLRFACSQSAHFDVVDWGMDLKRVLRDYLKDVDRISVDVNRGVALEAENVPAQITASVRTYNESGHHTSVIVATTSLHDSAYFIHAGMRSGFPVAKYRQPECISIHGPSGPYLGSIVLWQQVNSSPIPQEVIARLVQIRPFLTFLFTSFILRYQSRHGIYFETVKVARWLVHSAGLSRREIEVFYCRFQGLSIIDTALSLNISEATVRRHVRSIGKRIRAFGDYRADTLGLPFVRRTDVRR